jgi:hypothetical protein
MNSKKLTALILAIGACAIVAFLAYALMGLPSEDDPPEGARQDGTNIDAIKYGKNRADREYDILQSIELRAGPSEDHPRKINTKASRILKERHYLTVSSAVTVRVLREQDDWVEIQVTEPAHLTDSHRGWIPTKFIRRGESTRKISGWIRHRSLVYTSKSRTSRTVGYLSPPSSVGVADDGSGWLKLIHGPIKNQATNKFLDEPDYNGGLYIEVENFTTVLPSKRKL